MGVIAVICANPDIIPGIVEIPRVAVEEEKLIRDETDRPLLRAAIASACDYFLTGDKDFLESEITYPRIISVRDFLAL